MHIDDSRVAKLLVRQNTRRQSGCLCGSRVRQPPAIADHRRDARADRLLPLFGFRGSQQCSRLLPRPEIRQTIFFMETFYGHRFACRPAHWLPAAVGTQAATLCTWSPYSLCDLSQVTNLGARAACTFTNDTRTPNNDHSL